MQLIQKAAKEKAKKVRQLSDPSNLNGCGSIPHASRIGGGGEDSTLPTVGASSGVSLARISILRLLVSATRLLAVTIALHADVALLAPAATPAVADQPIVL